MAAKKKIKSAVKQVWLVVSEDGKPTPGLGPQTKRKDASDMVGDSTTNRVAGPYVLAERSREK